jgi:serine/threonine-protein kinase Chk1
LASSIGRKANDGRGRGTRQYLAPEVIREECFQLEPLDIWACGIVLVEMLANRLPWDSVDSQWYCQWKMNNKQYPFDLIHKSALGLIVLMLKENANDRATIHDIKNHT